MRMAVVLSIPDEIIETIKMPRKGAELWRVIL